MLQRICLGVVVVSWIFVSEAGTTGVSGHTPSPDEPKMAAPKPVPLKLAKPNKPLILLDAMVEGKGPYCFVLDTGASLTLISPELSKKLGIEPDKGTKPEKATGAGGNLPVHFGTAKSLKIANKELANFKIGIMDLTGISKAIETDLDGIIGYNFLKNYRVTVDYPKQVVVFE